MYVFQTSCIYLPLALRDKLVLSFHFIFIIIYPEKLIIGEVLNVHHFSLSYLKGTF